MEVNSEDEVDIYVFCKDIKCSSLTLISELYIVSQVAVPL